MTTPSLFLGFIISVLYGALFHLWQDGGAGRLLLYLIVSPIGFWSGHLLSGYWNFQLYNLGPLRLGMATAGSLVFLILGHWLSLVEGGQRQRGT